jgi:hypothetical protein
MKRARRGASAAPRWMACLAVVLASCAALSFALSARAFVVDPRADERSCAAADAADCPGSETSAALLGAELDVVVGPGFALVRGAQAVAEAACAAQPIATAALSDAVERAQRRLGIDAQIGIVLSSAAPSCNSMYYVPVANDVRGIGYQHDEGRELFDDSPDSALEGVAFLNDWPYWQAHPDEFRSAFHHEVAHRWGARVRAQIDGASSSELLGRGLSHWSYFLDTRGSPHEGNLWVSDGAGQHSETPLHGSQFSPLDAYLMGVGLPEEVQPFQLLRHPEVNGVDCRGQPVSAASPPQTCQSIEVTGEAARLSIDDILAVEGPRDPPPSLTPRSVTALVLVVDSPRAAFGSDACRELSGVLATRFGDFERATLGRLRLEQLLEGAGDCAAEEWQVPVASVSDEREVAHGCEVHGMGSRARSDSPGCSLLSVTLLLCCRRGSRGSALGLNGSAGRRG